MCLSACVCVHYSELNSDRKLKNILFHDSVKEREKPKPWEQNPSLYIDISNLKCPTISVEERQFIWDVDTNGQSREFTRGHSSWEEREGEGAKREKKTGRDGGITVQRLWRTNKVCWGEPVWSDWGGPRSNS